MTKPLDDDLSAAATSTDADSAASTAQHPLHGSNALDWAVKTFGFDLNATGTQPGVEDLQKWLLSNDKSVTPDGIWGPQTLRATEEAYKEQALSDSAEQARRAPASGFTKAGGQEQQAEADEPEPASTPQPGDDNVSARPVALSDSAIENISQDRLGFRPYVEAVAEFILAEQTRPPLAIAIDAPWGRGKTSFMKLIDAQLHSDAQQTAVKVVTTWFNPWKFSEPEQVWAAFVANVTRALRDGLTPGQSWLFRLRRLGTKWHRHADLPFLLRIFVALAFLFIVGSLALMDWSSVRGALFADQKTLKAFYEAANASSGGIFWYAPASLVVVLALVYSYVTFTGKLGLNLLEYVEKTDFKDKIGTLSQFEDEMKKLSKAVPDTLKVVVFIDDLDRCRGKVLGEIIEALQLADVSRSCVFILGMDMRKVANAVESDREELTLSVDSPRTRMEHGSGYKFLEKIIQARLSLPAYDDKNMRALVRSAVGLGEVDEGPQGTGAAPAGAAPPVTKAGTGGGGIFQGPLRMVRELTREKREIPKDSKAVTDTAEDYGSKHFHNPRRLKRFINSFRLQTYLAGEVRRSDGDKGLPRPLRSRSTQLDRLARFLVLAEKWPALVDYMLREGLGAQTLGRRLADADKKSTSSSILEEVSSLPGEAAKQLSQLLAGPKSDDMLEAGDLKELAEWYGFTYYRGLQGKNGDS
ncbi:P-loop NTPase fold protein [Pelagibius sp. CAU 1746]|uniref:P-loop NTPase fold protein n=1 Tax=Pelagibius sp. CAU 1746 TaxID=3140370 RepID=UPI00325BFCC2